MLKQIHTTFWDNMHHQVGRFVNRDVIFVGVLLTRCQRLILGLVVSHFSRRASSQTIQENCSFQTLTVCSNHITSFVSQVTVNSSCSVTRYRLIYNQLLFSLVLMFYNKNFNFYFFYSIFFQHDTANVGKCDKLGK